MPPPAVIALADEVRARLAQGNLAGRGPIELVPNGGLLDAELAARVVLADVAHCTQRGREESAPCWAELTAQLRSLERASYQRSAAR